MSACGCSMCRARALGVDTWQLMWGLDSLESKLFVEEPGHPLYYYEYKARSIRAEKAAEPVVERTIVLHKVKCHGFTHAILAPKGRTEPFVIPATKDKPEESLFWWRDTWVCPWRDFVAAFPAFEAFEGSAPVGVEFDSKAPLGIHRYPIVKGERRKSEALPAGGVHGLPVVVVENDGYIPCEDPPYFLSGPLGARWAEEIVDRWALSRLGFTGDVRALITISSAGWDTVFPKLEPGASRGFLVTT